MLILQRRIHICCAVETWPLKLVTKSGMHFHCKVKEKVYRKYFYAYICTNMYKYISVYMYVCIYIYMLLQKKFGESRKKCKRENITINSTITHFPMYSENIYSISSFFQIPFNLAAKMYGQNIRSCCITAVCLVAL